MSLKLIFYNCFDTDSISEIKKLTKPLLLNTAGKMTKFLIFILPKLFANPPLYLNLISLKHTISMKIIIMSLTAISLFLLCQTVGNLSLDLISPDSSNFSQTLQISHYPNFLLVYPLAPLSAGSAEKL